MGRFRLPRLLGLAMILSGLVWAAQGAGLFPYPERSPMVGDGAWVGWGLLLAAGGALMVWADRRRG
jgi:hypothetical protein